MDKVLLLHKLGQVGSVLWNQEVFGLGQLNSAEYHYAGGIRNTLQGARQKS